MSVEFEPVRLGARRRRIDPVAVGAAIVVIALAVSIVKPWDVSVPGASSAASGDATPGPAGELAAAPASPIPTASTALPRIIAARTTLPPTWGQVEPVVRLHEAWGVRVIVVEASNNGEPTAGQRFAERWFGFPNDGAAGSTAVVDPGGRSIVALGVAFRAPGGGVWEPGVYRITVVWQDFDGQHEGSWHAELLPGPVRELPQMLSAARSWTRFAGADGVILGMAEPLVGGPRAAAIRPVHLQPGTVDYPVASGIGCGATVIDGNPGILGFAA